MVETTCADRFVSNYFSNSVLGKGYWSGGAKILGVVEDEHGLRFGH